MPDAFHTGLRLRLRRALRRIEAQHDELRRLFSEGDAAARSGAERRAWRACLCDALCAHFQLEDEMVFPALHGLYPRVLPTLAELSREHETFLAQLRAMLDAADGTPDDFPAMRHAFGDHERREEALLASVLERRSRGRRRR
jgi:hypothetical protein